MTHTHDLWRDTPDTHGSCQCGATRYHITAGPTKATLCHCRMCQRATGSPYAALLEVPRKRITWHGSPARYASSNRADRGFCPTCGTPLFYDFHDRDVIEVTVGSLPTGFPYEPRVQYGVESRHHWTTDLRDIPGFETLETSVQSNQSNDGA